MIFDTIDDPAHGDAAVASLVAEGVAAIVYASPYPRPIHTSQLLDGTRTIFVNCWPETAGTAHTAILADEYAGGYAAAKAVIDLGHRDVAFIGGMADDWARGERRRGFQDAARQAGINSDDLIQVSGNYMIGSGYDLTLQVCQNRPPTALLCGNDRMAVGALLALHTLRLECPADVSIVGFDDQPDVADQVRPALTTVALPHLQMGHLAGDLVVNPPVDPPKSIVVPCQLIQRKSLSAPAIIRSAQRPYP